MYALYTLNDITNEWEWDIICNNVEQSTDIQQFYEYELGTATRIERINSHTDNAING